MSFIVGLLLFIAIGIADARLAWPTASRRRRGR